MLLRLLLRASWSLHGGGVSIGLGLRVCTPPESDVSLNNLVIPFFAVFAPSLAILKGFDGCLQVVEC